MRTRTVIAVGALLGAACAGRADSQSTWTTHRDPRGWIVDVPPGWTARYEVTPHRRLVVDGRDGARAIIIVAHGDFEMTAEGGLASAARFVTDADAAVHWTRPKLVAPTIAFVAGTSGARTGQAYVNWISTPARSVAYMYASSGPRDALARDRAAIARVFGSFRIATPPAGATSGANAAPELRYTTFTDPQEHAFSVELPAAWQRDGALYRQTASDFRPAFRAGIPGSVLIRSGDQRLPYFEVPNQMLAIAGLREGDLYRQPDSVKVVRRFVDGTTFARDYARTQFADVCSGVTIDDTRPRSDAVAGLNAVYGRFAPGIDVRFDAGEAAFSCTAGGNPMHGYVFAVSRLITLGAQGIWNVPHLLSYVARPEYAAQAHAALDHAAASYRVDDAWEARNLLTVQHTSEIARESGQAMAKIISDTYWNNTERRTAAVENYDRSAVRGHQFATDPVTHTRMEVDNRFQYNFIDPSGHITGSDVSALPSAEFRRLVTAP